MRFIKLTRTAVGQPVYIDPRFIRMMNSGKTIDGYSYTKIFLGNMEDPIYVIESIESIMEVIKLAELADEAENERKKM